MHDIWPSRPTLHYCSVPGRASRDRIASQSAEASRFLARHLASAERGGGPAIGS